MMTAGQVLDQFLRALGVAPTRIPEDEEERVSLYRSVMHGRKALVLLDNAHDSAQVRPLLPPSGPAFTLITSRSRMSGLAVNEGVERIILKTFDPESAVGLLTYNASSVGDTESSLALTIAGNCDFLPLCLRIILDRMTYRGHTSFRESAEEILAEIQRTRTVFDIFAPLDGDQSAEVRLILSWSYNDLPRETATVFRRLGLHPGVEFGIDDAIELAGLASAEAMRSLDRLVQLSMIEYIGDRRYRFHDLMRAFAAERAREEDDPVETNMAVKRLTEYYIRQVDAVDRVLAPGRRHVLSAVAERPPFESYASAVQWCETERANLMAALRSAAAAGLHDLCWKLAMALITFFHLRKYRADRLESCEISLRSSQIAGNKFGEAWSLLSLGGAHMDVQNYDEARLHLERSLQLWRELSDREGVGKCLDNLIEISRMQGDGDNALQIGLEALALKRDLHNPREITMTLHNLGDIEIDRGDYASAKAYFDELLAMRQYADPQVEGLALRGLAIIAHRLGDLDASRRNFEQAIASHREFADAYGEAITRRALSSCLRDSGLVLEARSELLQALDTLRALNDPAVPDLLRDLQELDL